MEFKITEAEHIKRLIDIRQENLWQIDAQIARHGMNPPLELLNQKNHHAEEIEKLRLQFIELEHNPTSFENSQDSKSIISEELRHRLAKLREFRDIATQIQASVVQNATNQSFINTGLLERFSYLYAEVARYMIETLEILGFEKSQISECIMKFVNTPPFNPHIFIVETNQGLSFIQMVLRYHEIMEST